MHVCIIVLMCIVTTGDTRLLIRTLLLYFSCQVVSYRIAILTNRSIDVVFALLMLGTTFDAIATDFDLVFGHRTMVRMVLAVVYMDACKVILWNLLFSIIVGWQASHNIRALQSAGSNLQSTASFVWVEICVLFGMVVLCLLVQHFFEETVRAQLDMEAEHRAVDKILAVLCDAVVHLGPSGEIVHASPQLRHIFRTVHDELLEGSLLAKYLASAHDRLRFEELISARRSQDAASALHVHVQICSEQPRPVTLFHVYMPDTEGNPGHVIGLRETGAAEPVEMRSTLPPTKLLRSVQGQTCSRTSCSGESLSSDFVIGTSAQNILSVGRMNPSLGLWHEEGSVGSQSSRETVRSFWDAMRLLVGCDVRPGSVIYNHLSRLPEITWDYDELVWDLLEEENLYLTSPAEIVDRIQERVEEDFPPPISAEQWTRAAFRVAEGAFTEAIVHGIERSRRHEQASSALAAAMLSRQPIQDIPVEASNWIAAATGEAGMPPGPADQTMVMTEFFNWFRSLYHELHPEQADLTQEELQEYWDSFALEEMAVHGQDV